MQKEYYSPNDDEAIGYDDSLSIQNAIELAKLRRIDRVVIPRYNRRTGSDRWVITRPILLPSDIEVVLDNCYLIMADGVIGNMFRNSAIKTEKAYDFGATEVVTFERAEERQKNIIIKGEGHAVLDGGKSNNILELNWRAEGRPNPKNNNIILLSEVDGFEISDITVTNPRWWAVNIAYCTHGKISDIYFYARNTVPNQDGVHLIEGCSDITVERISGQSGDDLVALTAITPDYVLSEDAKIERDIHDIKIKDIIGTSVRQAVLAMRCQDDHKMYNIAVENLIQSDGGDKNNYPYSAIIRIGTNGYFVSHEAPIGNRRNLTIRNVIAPVHTGLVFCEEMQDCEFENIRQVGGLTPMYIDGVKIRNLKIKGLYASEGITGCPIFTENGQREGDFIENLSIEGLYYKGKNGISNLKIDEKTDIVVDGKKL